MHDVPRETRASVSVAIFDDADPARVLVVQRPHDDPDLPDAWGLPAATLRPGESWQDAVRRAGREKLGVDIDVGDLLNEGTAERPSYTLHMRLYGGRIARGTPRTGQPYPDVTQYQRWGWGDADTLRPAAARGSLCCRLFLNQETPDAE